VCETLDVAAGVAENFMWGGEEEGGSVELADLAAGDGEAGRYAKHAQRDGYGGSEDEDALVAGLGMERRQGLNSSGVAAREAGGHESAPEADKPVEVPAQHTEWGRLLTEERLLSVLQYLRGTYCYCLHCGVQYSDAEDMSTHCPGLHEDDH
jgi:hypothetical protein